jgi:hypothetical protein
MLRTAGPADVPGTPDPGRSDCRRSDHPIRYGEAWEAIVSRVVDVGRSEVTDAGDGSAAASCWKQSSLVTANHLPIKASRGAGPPRE